MATTPGFYYCNDIRNRCNNSMCRDCSTFAASGLNAGFPGTTNPCGNSFSQAEWCYQTPRPDWFTARFGPGQGTFITYDQAQHAVCLGFRGTDWGMRPDYTGDGHVECILGQGARTVGAHSHETGVGFDNNGINNHQLSYFAVPPCFLPEMAGPPIDAATLQAIRDLVEWQQRVARRPLNVGMKNGDVTILKKLLIHRKLLRPQYLSNVYGRRTVSAVATLEKQKNLSRKRGKVVDGPVAAAVLAP